MQLLIISLIMYLDVGICIGLGYLHANKATSLMIKSDGKILQSLACSLALVCVSSIIWLPALIFNFGDWAWMTIFGDSLRANKQQKETDERVTDRKNKF